MKKFIRRRLFEIKNTTKRAKDQIAETFNKNEGFGAIEVVLLIVVVVVIFALIVLPQSRAFISNMFTKMTTYVESLPLFPTT